ncbi:MAG: hypothetical protein AAGD07_19540 [Planctomycetota bacterium]
MPKLAPANRGPEQRLAPQSDQSDLAHGQVTLDEFARLCDRPSEGDQASKGPGSELKRMLPWLSTAAKAKPLQRRIATVNSWGVKGCRLNAETIAAWLVAEAAKQGMDADELSFSTARSLVLTAIRRYERKFPDGPLETN